MVLQWPHIGYSHGSNLRNRINSLTPTPAQGSLYCNKQQIAHKIFSRTLHTAPVITMALCWTLDVCVCIHHVPIHDVNILFKQVWHECMKMRIQINDWNRFVRLHRSHAYKLPYQREYRRLQAKRFVDKCDSNSSDTNLITFIVCINAWSTDTNAHGDFEWS